MSRVDIALCERCSIDSYPESRRVIVGGVIPNVVSVTLNLSCVGHESFSAVVSRGAWRSAKPSDYETGAGSSAQRYVLVRVTGDDGAVRRHLFELQKVDYSEDGNVILSGQDAFSPLNMVYPSSLETTGDPSFTANGKISAKTYAGATSDGIFNGLASIYTYGKLGGNGGLPYWCSDPCRGICTVQTESYFEFDVAPYFPKMYDIAASLGYIMLNSANEVDGGKITPYIYVARTKQSSVALSDATSFNASEYSIDDSNRVDSVKVIGLDEGSGASYTAEVQRTYGAKGRVGGLVEKLSSEVLKSGRGGIDRYLKTAGRSYLSDHCRYDGFKVAANPSLYRGIDVAPFRESAADVVPGLYLGSTVDMLIDGSPYSLTITGSTEVFKEGYRSCELTVGTPRPSNQKLFSMR